MHSIQSLYGKRKFIAELFQLLVSTELSVRQFCTQIPLQNLLILFPLAYLYVSNKYFKGTPNI